MLHGAAVGFVTGDWDRTSYAAPVGLVGLAAVLVGVRLLENEVPVGQ